MAAGTRRSPVAPYVAPSAGPTTWEERLVLLQATPGRRVRHGGHDAVEHDRDAVGAAAGQRRARPCDRQAAAALRGARGQGTGAGHPGNLDPLGLWGAVGAAFWGTARPAGPARGRRGRGRRPAAAPMGCRRPWRTPRSPQAEPQTVLERPRPGPQRDPRGLHVCPGTTPGSQATRMGSSIGSGVIGRSPPRRRGRTGPRPAAPSVRTPAGEPRCRPGTGGQPARAPSAARPSATPT